MKNLDQQFVCKDCTRFDKCKYYHNRQEGSQICKYFHLFPDNATNGDIIKAMFPNADIWIVEEEKYVCVSFEGMYAIKTFTLDWWNAPYRREGEEEC